MSEFTDLLIQAFTALEAERNAQMQDIMVAQTEILTLLKPKPDSLSLPPKTDAMFYYQHGDQPQKLWQFGETPPDDGTLHLNVANSIDGNNDQPNSPVVGIDWKNYPGEAAFAMHFWWNHQYGKSAGARCVFSRNVWKPIGLLPYKESTIYALMDFMSPAFPIGQGFERAWVTWPFEFKAHDPYKAATVGCNVDQNLQLYWGNWWPNTKLVVNNRFQMKLGQLHRMLMRIDMFSDPTKGRFQAWIDGQHVVDQQGQMAMSTGGWLGCGVFIPCLYGNVLTGLTEGYIRNMIVSTQPIV